MVYEQLELFGGNGTMAEEKEKRTRSQIGRSARKKGLNAQNEYVKEYGGQVVPASGAAGGKFGNDVHLENGYEGEIKRFATGEKTLYSWIMDEREKPDFVAFRADRMPWVAAMKAEVFHNLVNVQVHAERVRELTVDGFPDHLHIDEFIQAMHDLETALDKAKKHQGE